MTQNQINYWKLQEDSRHNQASETETNRHNVQQEGIDLSALAETSRHNRAGEAETQRHNVAAEGETARHNRSTEGIDLGRLTETARHNVASENIDLGQLSESSRHNQAAEALSRYQNQTNRLAQAEEARHNTVSETNQSYNAVSDRIRANADAALKEVQTQLASIDTDWRALQNAENVRLTHAQIDRFDQQNDEIEQKIELMQSQIQNNDLDAAWRTYDELLKGLGAASNVLTSVSKLFNLGG